MVSRKCLSRRRSGVVSTDFSSERGASVLEYVLLNACLGIALIVGISTVAQSASTRLNGEFLSAIAGCTARECGGSTEGTTGDTMNQRQKDDPIF